MRIALLGLLAIPFAVIEASIPAQAYEYPWTYKTPLYSDRSLDCNYPKSIWPLSADVSFVEEPKWVSDSSCYIYKNTKMDNYY